MPLRAGQKLDLHTVGLERVDWRVQSVRPPFLALLASKSDFSDTEDVDFDTVSEMRKGTVKLDPANPYKAQYIGLDVDELDGKKQGQSSLFYLTLTGSANGMEKCQVSRLILISDLGLMLKTSADGTHHAFVRKLSQAAPQEGCKIMLLGANGVPVAQGTTDANGRCDLPSTYGLMREKRPVAVIAQKGRDLAWLSFNQRSTNVDYGDFASEGRHATAEGLMASVFSQRGIYMPGETLNFGAIVTNQKWQVESKDLSVTAILYGPGGNELYREKVQPKKDGLVTFAWKSDPDCATGTYRLDLNLDLGHKNFAILGTTHVRIEEFQPDTLALRLTKDKDAPKGWIKVDPKAKSKIKVNLDNLYGEPARNHRIKATLHTDPSTLSLAGYSDFTFSDLTKSNDTQDLNLPDAYTNEQGEVWLDLPLDKLALGTRSGQLMVEGFEKSGGRAVGRRLNLLFSPKSYVLGFKPEGDANTLSYLPENSKANLRLLIVDNNLTPKRLDKVVVKVSGLRFVTSLVSDTQGFYRYDATPVDTEINRSELTIEEAGSVVNLDTKTPGDFLLTVVDPSGETLASIPYSVAGTNLAKPGHEPVLVNGTLGLKIAKDNYQPGDTVNFRISAPYDGFGLVTLEREKVLTHAWFAAKAGESVHEIKIPADFEGRAYVNVSFVRNIDSPSIYMDPHCYALAPITVGVDRREMGLSLQAPNRVKPGQEVTVKIKSKNKGHVQLFAVDEGVLQLTGYTLPNPLKDLLTDRALDVETRQAYNLLMPDHERLRGRIPGFGGGMGNGGGRFLNPFRRKSEPPFAFWSQLLEIDPAGTSVTFKVPDYFSGQFRIMAVGSGQGSDGLVVTGSTQASARVRGEVIIKPELPLVVAPKDVFEGAVVLANTVSGSGANAKVAFELTLPRGLTLTSGKSSLVLDIPENEERAVPFAVKVGETLGAQDFIFKAKLASDAKEVVRTQSISIRPAEPKMRTERAISLGRLAAGKTDQAELESTRVLYPYEASTTLSVAAAPILSLRSILERLDAYPYGCTEQKISRAFPYVFLWDRPKLRDTVLSNAARPLNQQLKVGEKNISEAILAIRAALQYDGVSLWPGSNDANLFVTAYAADFLLSMREHGLGCPDDLIDRLFQILEDRLTSEPNSLEDGRYKIYACWILQRDGRIMTSTLRNLENWFSQHIRNWERDVVTSLLADSYATLRLNRRAQELLVPQDVLVTTDPLFSSGMARSLHALIVLESFGGVRKAGSLISGIQDAVLRPSATTVDLAMGARVLAALATNSANIDQSLKIDCINYNQDFMGPQVTTTIEGMSSISAPGCQRFRLKGELDPDLTVLLTEDGFDRAPQDKPQKGNLELRKQLLNVQGAKATAAELGEVLTCQICARSLGKSVNNVVIQDLVAGGLEPILEKTPLEQGEGFLRYERREDRGLFFVDLVPEERCFTYRLRAATKGQFVLPATQAEGMYQPELNGRSTSSTLEIR